MSLSPGTRLGSYEVVAAIGAGGMGEVYRARDTKLDRDVALKVLPESLATDPDRLMRFEREAKTLAALNHPNIVTLHSVEEAGGVRFLTMELVEGRALDQLIPQDGLEIRQVLDIGVGLSDALAAAHERGIVHRDLKPGNVMVTRDGSVKVLDFGLAKAIRDVDEAAPTVTAAGHTEAGVVLGTWPYMSPEQIQGRDVDYRTDLFSVGVMLYEMTTGRRPFQGTSSAELFASILRDDAPLVTELRADAPPDLVRVIRRCLERDPRRRIQTARDVGNELRDAWLGARDSRRAPAHSTGRSPSMTGDGAPAASSGEARADEGFWVGVLPFRHAGPSAELAVLADGLTEEIITGLSRFSYLRVIAHSSIAAHDRADVDGRAVGREIGARYVMEGSLRQAGAHVRVTVQVVDAATGAHLWAETYDRPFDPASVFTLQDDLVARVVATCADRFGVIPRSISDAVREKPPETLTPYEALLRGFGYHHRLAPAEHAAAREALERAVERAPGNADCWAMLSWVYSHEHAHGFNPRPSSLDRALSAARRAVDLAPSSQLAHQALAVALFFRRDVPGCLSAAERAIALNPLDTSNEAFFLIAFAGDWERGAGLIARAIELNPHHPRWYELALGLCEYHAGRYREAVALAVEANTLDIFWTHALLAGAHAQLGDLPAARRSLSDLLERMPDYASWGQAWIGKWFEPEMADRLVKGLRKAGLEMPEGSTGPSAPQGA